MRHYTGRLILVAPLAMFIPVLAWSAGAAEAAFRRAAELVSHGAMGNHNSALVQAVQAALPLYPVAGISTQETCVVQTVLTLNREGLGFGAFRFTAPPPLPSLLFWSFAVPPEISISWMIVPATGNIPGFTSPRLSLPSFECTTGPWIPESVVGVQILFSELLDPGREYIICLGLQTVDPVEVTVRLFASSDPTNRTTGFFRRIVFGVQTNGVSFCLDETERSLAAMGLMTPWRWQRAVFGGALDMRNDRTALDRLISTRAVDLVQIDAAWMSAHRGGGDVLRYLLSRGADPNRIHDGSDKTPLHALAGYERGTVRTAERYDAEDLQLADGVDHLVQAGADVNRIEPAGRKTPLMLAAYHLRPATCQRLIELGADVSLRDAEGRTALEKVRQTRPDAWVRKAAGTEARRERVLTVLADAERNLPPEAERYAGPDALASLTYDGTPASLLRLRAAIRPAVEKDANIVAIALARQICFCLGEAHLLERLPLAAARLHHGETIRRWSAAVHEKAVAGDPFFACAYALLLSDGRDGADDPAFSDTLAVCRRFSKAGFGEATRKLAVIHELRENAPDEPDRRLAGAQGNMQALYELGLQNYCGRYAPHDYAKAADCFTEAAAHGHATAMICLGRCYMRGQGVARDPEAARKWWLRAQAAGAPAASRWLAFYFPAKAPAVQKEVSLFDEVEKE